MSDIVLDILKATLRFIVEIICFYTGELILFVLTCRAVALPLPDMKIVSHFLLTPSPAYKAYFTR